MERVIAVGVLQHHRVIEKHDRYVIEQLQSLGWELFVVCPRTAGECVIAEWGNAINELLKLQTRWAQYVLPGTRPTTRH